MGFCRIATLWIIGSLVGAALAQEAVPNGPSPQSENSVLGIATYPLWRGGAPDARGTGDGDVPLLTEFRPQPHTGNGTAVIIAPGGAYLGLASNLEGRQVADWYASRGITAFVLRYRLGSQYLYPIPLQDAQRAIRFVRSQAKAFGLVPESPDVIDRASCRPDFVVLGYPWLNAMQKNETGVLSYCSALKISAERCSNFEQYSPDLHISAQTPPTFIYHTTDDELVPVEASLRYYKALRTAGLPVEMHLFQHGRHGSGLGLGDASLDLWPTLLESWLRRRGLLTSGDAATASKHN